MRPTLCSLTAAMVILAARVAYAADPPIEKAISDVSSIDRDVDSISLPAAPSDSQRTAAERKLKQIVMKLENLIDPDEKSLAAVGVAGESSGWTVASDRSTALAKARDLKTKAAALANDLNRRQNMDKWVSSLTACKTASEQLKSATATLASAVDRVKDRAETAARNLATMLATFDSQADELDRALDAIDEQREPLVRQADTLRDAIDELREEIETIEKEGAPDLAAQERKAGRIAEKRRQAEAKATELVRVNQRLGTLNTQYASADAALAAAHGRFMAAAQDAEELTRNAGHWRNE